jgi:hypothetical protein
MVGESPLARPGLALVDAALPATALGNEYRGDEKIRRETLNADVA